MKYVLNTEAERIEFMIHLTERANDRGDFDNQIDRMCMAYLAEISGIPYDEIYSDKPIIVPVVPEKTEVQLSAEEKALANFDSNKEIEV